MSTFLPSSEVYIHGNVEKLLQVASVQGNLIIINDKDAGARTLDTSKSEERDYSLYKEEEYKKQVGLLFADNTEAISLLIKSRRFGRKVKFKVPWDMKIWAFIEYMIEALVLPREQTAPKLGIGFRFTYVLCTTEPLDADSSFREAGVTEGNELELRIDVAIADREVSKLEGELRYIYSCMYLRFPQEKVERINSRIEEIRSELYTRYAEDILKAPWFTYLDTPSEYMMLHGSG